MSSIELGPETANHRLLVVEDVTRSFGGLMALAGVSLSIHSGEILGLIGPNGSGKSTLFNVITGFLKPDTGTVRFKGTEITGAATHRICRFGVARTFQMVRPFPHLTALQNVLAGRIYGRQPTGSLSQGIDEAREILELVGLGQRQETLARDLTIMDRKRLELARSLAVKPELLLLDEFMTGLNPAEMGSAIELLKRINQRGVTLVVVEHIVKAVMNLSDRIVVLNAGRVIAEGTPQAVSADPEVISAYLGSNYAES